MLLFLYKAIIITLVVCLGILCNGNTADSGSAFGGSNPSIPGIIQFILLPSSRG